MAIFSGKSSRKFWNAVNRYGSQRRGKDKYILFDYGCKAQEIEALLEQLIPIAEKADTDDSEDTTIELAKQALSRS